MNRQKGATFIEVLVVCAIIGILAGIVISAVRAPRAEASTRACGGWFEPSCDSATAQQAKEQETATAMQRRLENSVPIPQLETSLERTNIAKRLALYSDESKISYIYLVSFGKVMTNYTVKGKITSGGKRLTSNERLVTGASGGNYSDQVMEAAELDGTYGHSGDYIFFWTTDGTYVQWNGEYMLADQPLKLTTQPELIRTIQ